MKTNPVFLFCILAISCQLALGQRSSNGYVYDKPNFSHTVDLPAIGGPQHFNSLPQHQHQHQQQAPKGTDYYQQLRPPPLQQSNQASYYFDKGQSSLQNHQTPVNFGPGPAPQQQFNQPALNIQLPAPPQLNNVNYNPQQQQFNPQATGQIQQTVFEVHDDTQGYNSIEPGCGPEPIIGQFKPELVDLANGGPLTRMITTCGPNNDCKNIVLQSDLNRVLAQLPNQNNNNNNNGPHHQGYQEYHVQIEGRGNSANYIQAETVEPLFRPRNRRLIPYTEISSGDDVYN